MKAATKTAQEHPSRIVVVIGRPGRSGPRLDAEVRVGGDAGPGETIVLRLHGVLADHADSVVLPLLLPDAPVVTWWPGAAPGVPSTDPLGALAQRRVTDAAAAEEPLAEIVTRAQGYSPGDTDLAWTRLTPWRSLLAAALEQKHSPVVGAAVEAEQDNAPAELLALWLEDRLGVPARRGTSAGPGITAVTLRTEAGDIAITRPDGRLAVLTMPGEPDRPVALKRRELAELIAEELRRLDPDDIYQATVRCALTPPTASAAPDAPDAPGPQRREAAEARVAIDYGPAVTGNGSAGSP
jgi:glucose-6-phosphate dehydrogenase assembly protein OpcA